MEPASATSRKGRLRGKRKTQTTWKIGWKRNSDIDIDARPKCNAKRDKDQRAASEVTSHNSSSLHKPRQHRRPHDPSETRPADVWTSLRRCRPACLKHLAFAVEVSEKLGNAQVDDRSKIPQSHALHEGLQATTIPLQRESTGNVKYYQWKHSIPKEVQQPGKLMWTSIFSGFPRHHKTVRCSSGLQIEILRTPKSLKDTENRDTSAMSREMQTLNTQMKTKLYSLYSHKPTYCVNHSSVAGMNILPFEVLTAFIFDSKLCSLFKLNEFKMLKLIHGNITLYDEVFIMFQSLSSLGSTS